VQKFDVAIIGGGVVGASIAFELAEEELTTIVLDSQQPGLEASWAAAGMLSPAPHVPEDAPLTPLGSESLRLYPEFVAQIEEASGLTTDFARNGSLEIFFKEHGESERDRVVNENRLLEIPCEPISLGTAREMEPLLGPAARAAMWLPQETSIDPRALMEALLAAVRRRGIEIRSNFPVTGLLLDGDHCHGVFAAGEKVTAKHVVVAAGAFCGKIAQEKTQGSDILARYACTHPVRGQMLALQPAGFKLRKVLRSKRGYMVPRRDGRIVAGSTLEHAGFVKQVTAESISQILEGVAELVPELAGAEVVETWAGLRPGSPDGLPIIGPTDIGGLLIATGHYRNGILLAPVTAKLIREWITRGKTTFDTDRFSPMRFTRDGARTSNSQIARQKP
jgi:glycine oxidase